VRIPAFRRLKRQAWIRGEWRAAENNRRAKYYVLTKQGRKKLKNEAREWHDAQSGAIVRILEAASGELGRG